LTNWRALPSLTALRAFDATAQNGDFAGAARSLNVTHAAIAQQVRALEAELGLRLATRQGRHVQLTDAGRALALALTDGFETISDAIAGLKQDAQTRALRVTTTPFLTERVIMPRLSEFWNAHPGAEISLFPTREYVDIQKEGFDLAIRAIFADDASHGVGTDQTLIGEVSLIGIASPALIRAHGNDPHGLPWLWHDGMATKISLMRQCGLDIERLTQIRIGSPNLLLQAVRQGLGATIFNETIARQEIALGDIDEVPLPRSARVPYVAVTPKGPRHPLAMSFADWVRTLV
jgi:LysR family glycine cleavage system transcriptional activator